MWPFLPYDLPSQSFYYGFEDIFLIFRKIVKKYKNTNWLGLISACVSMEIVEKSSFEMKNLNVPFGFKVNLWGVDEPLPVHQFNTAKFDEIGKNPNISLGTREGVTGKILCSFAKKIVDDG